jgi:cytochrome c556
VQRLYHDPTPGIWKDIRDFPAIHYKFSGTLDTLSWQNARADIDD